MKNTIWSTPFLERSFEILERIDLGLNLKTNFLADFCSRSVLFQMMVASVLDYSGNRCPTSAVSKILVHPKSFLFFILPLESNCDEWIGKFPVFSLVSVSSAWSQSHLKWHEIQIPQQKAKNPTSSFRI